MKCMIMNKKASRIIAISFIAMSFVLYIILPFNTCLPFSGCTIAAITAGMMILSEVIFWIGSLMIGREVAQKIRKKFSIVNWIKHIKERRKGK